MHIRRGQLLPRSLLLLRAVKRAIGLCVVFAVLLGIIASLDALMGQIRTPRDALSVFSGGSTTISGTLSSEGSASSVVLRFAQPAEGVRVDSIRYSRSVLSKDVHWTAELFAAPETTPGVYSITAESKGAPQHLADHWRLTVFGSVEELQAQSPFLFERAFGADPLVTAIRALILAVVSGVLYLAAFLIGSHRLAREGYFRVYFTRPEGDDTMLYCIDSERILSEERPYPVLSAAGQLIGLANVSGRGARHCVLKLSAAQARAGCLIAVAP